MTTDQRHLDHARAILRRVPIIDGHNDLAWVFRKRFDGDLEGLDLSQDQTGVVMTDIPRLRSGMVGAQFWAAYTPADWAGPGATRAGAEQVDLIHRLVARYADTFALARTADDVERIQREGKIAALIGLEGGYMLENSLGALRSFYRDGVRYLTLTHVKNIDWADASTDEVLHNGLTAFGREVIREMNRLGMMVDCSHVSDATAWDAIQTSEAPVICSHSSSRHFSDHPRSIPDDLAAAIAESGGIIMPNFYPAFLSQPYYDWAKERDAEQARLTAAGAGPGTVEEPLRRWVEAHPAPLPDVALVADHIEHLRGVAGADHIGIGSDFDGIPVTPKRLEDVSMYPNLIAELVGRGWADDDVERLAGRNLLRVMRAVETVATRLQDERGPSTARIEVLDRDGGTS